MARYDAPRARLDGAPLDYAPENELGVVFLFAELARRRFGLRVERIQSGFPDCIAYRDGKRVRIEFEYRSRNFALHRHDRKTCDWIVCWIHDWAACPHNLRVIELRRHYGKGFNVWVVPITGGYREKISEASASGRWSAPSQASTDDLILFYRTKPDGYVRDIFRLSGPVQYVSARWKPGKDYMASIRRVASLRNPLHLAQLQSHSVLSSAGFVRGGLRARFRVTSEWPELYQMIVDKNPSVEKTLRRYGPLRIV